MARSFLDRWREDPWIQSGEAVGHIFVAFASIAIFAGFHAWGFPYWEVAGGAAATLPWRVLRELIDQWPIASWLDTFADQFQMSVGGALGGLLFKAVS